MANIDVSKITLPNNNNTYIIKDSLAVTSIARDGTNYKVTKRDNSTFNIQAPIPFIVGTGSTKGTWLGELPGLTEYYDGLIILYKPAVAGASTTTLNLNSLGAKTCYINHTTKLTTHYPVNQPILLVYSTSQNSGCWEALDNYWTDSNTYDRNKYTGTVLCGSVAIAAKNIIVGTNAKSYHQLKDGTAFDIRYPILYANSAIAANGTGADNYDIIAFTVTTTQSITLTPYLPVYIKGTLSGTTFTPVSTTPLTQTAPSTADGYYYILLGIGYNSTAIYLTEDHRIFAYKNGAFGEIVNDALSVNGHTVAKDVPSGAEFTDTTYTGTGLISINSSNVISTTAEVNQNAFSNVKVGTTTIAADTKTDTLELAAGNGIMLIPDATNDKVTINSNIYYGTCTTAASTAAKVATLVNSTGFTLTTGVTVKIKFSNYNNVANPTLNVSSTGAIPIMRYGTTAVTTSVQGSWADGAIITLTYDGTNWILNDKNETYVGTSRYAHAEGQDTIANANNSHAEGHGTTASGYGSHAEGGYTIASGNESHAEGGYTPLGGASIIYTIASGDSSHAEGFGTIANHKSQHVFGEFNIEDASTANATDTGTYVEIVGNGIAEDARSNARTLDWGGNEVLAGSIGISNGACKLQYNSTTASCDFIFA